MSNRNSRPPRTVVFAMFLMLAAAGWAQEETDMPSTADRPQHGESAAQHDEAAPSPEVFSPARRALLEGRQPAARDLGEIESRGLEPIEGRIQFGDLFGRERDAPRVRDVAQVLWAHGLLRQAFEPLVP